MNIHKRRQFKANNVVFSSTPLAEQGDMQILSKLGLTPEMWDAIPSKTRRRIRQAYKRKSNLARRICGVMKHLAGQGRFMGWRPPLDLARTLPHTHDFFIQSSSVVILTPSHDLRTRKSILASPSKSHEKAQPPMNSYVNSTPHSTASPYVNSTPHPTVHSYVNSTPHPTAHSYVSSSPASFTTTPCHLSSYASSSQFKHVKRRLFASRQKERHLRREGRKRPSCVCVCVVLLNRENTVKSRCGDMPAD
jgi:hypothetical protein